MPPSPVAFDDQPLLTGASVWLRPLTQDDFGRLSEAAAHPEIWAGHPVKDRHRSEVFAPYFDFLIKAGGTLAILSRPGDGIIGCSRYYAVAERPGSIAIGFTFLNHAHWGGTMNFDVKRLMLDHAFARFPEVWFDIAPDNIRSQKATMKLGAEHVRDARLTLADSAADWKCYRLTRAAWVDTVAARV